MAACSKNSIAIWVDLLAILLPMKKIRIDLPDSKIDYFPDQFSAFESEDYLQWFEKQDLWKQDHIKLFGKQVLQPRLTALFGENGLTYTYSGLTMHPIPFPEDILIIKSRCEDLAESDFNICLANFYRNGQDSMGWHADDEKELGSNPVIASVNFGAPRAFHFRHKSDKNLKEKIILENGSILIMAGKTQHYYKHQLPKTAKKIGPRVNLTFRKVF